MDSYLDSFSPDSVQSSLGKSAPSEILREFLNELDFSAVKLDGTHRNVKKINRDSPDRRQEHY